jgi:hypothetical protein
MLLGFVGLGAVVETAYLPALRSLFGDSLRCVGFDVQPTKQPAGDALYVARRAAYSAS